MDKVNGSAYQTTNVRSAAKVVDSPTNVLRKLVDGDKFTGVIVMRGSEKWIILETVNGIAVTRDEFVASWVVNSTVVVTTPPTEEPPVSDPFVKAQLLNKDGVVVEEYTMVKL
jgi:hypothetical protein